MNLKKMFMVVFIVALSCSFLFAAGEGESQQSNEIRAVFLVKKLSSSFWTDMVEAAEAQAEEYGWNLEVLSPIVADSNEEQIQLLEQSLLNPPDIYLIAAADSKGIAPAIEMINEEDVPIIAVSARILGEGLQYETFVGVEFYDIAKSSARALAERLDGKGNILFLEGVTGASSAMDINRGAQEVFAEYPEITILASQPANYQRQEALTVTQNLLQRYSDVDAIFASNGEMALGAVEALRQAGRSGISIATLNSSEELVRAIDNGEISLTADDVSWKVGQQAVVAAKRVLDGETLPKDSLQEAVIVDESTLAEYKAKYGIE